MKRYPQTGRFVVIVLALVVGVVLLGACAGGSRSLRTEYARDTGAIEGNYTVILYNDESYKGLAVLGILSAKNSGYTIVPYAPSYNYTIQDNVIGQAAIQIASGFVQKNPSFLKAQVSAIFAPSGQVIGYEVRPLFVPFEFGTGDPMSVSYFLETNSVVQVDIDVIPAVKKRLEGR